MFQKLIEFSIRNKMVVMTLTVALIVWGGWSLSRLPFDSTPDITNNQVQVVTQAPQLGAQEVEQYITTPIEMAFANIPRLTERRSISRSGLSVITLVFDDDADIYWARQQVSQQIKEAEEQIPKGMGTVSMGPISTGLGEIFHYTIRAKKGYESKYSQSDLRTIQDWIVRKQLGGTPGVAEISGWGGFVKQCEIAINADKLNSYGITIPELYDAVEKGNENTGGSYIEKNSRQYFIRGIGVATSLSDLEKIPVKVIEGNPVLVGDIANVREGYATRFGAVTRNGEGEVVAGITLMLKGENFQEVIANVKSRMTQIEKSLPEGVVIEPFIDRTQLVDRVTGTIAKNLVEGGLIVIFILVVFLGNLRGGLVVASVIPLSMLFAFGMMKLFGVSGNLMSLGAIDFGLIVDGAVIIVEAVYRHISQTHLKYNGLPLTQGQMDEEVLLSASRIRKSAAFGEIIIMMVYVPLFSLTGIEGKMFRPMALTVFFAILGAFILSLTYVPVASTLFLSKKSEHERNLSDRLMEKLERAYRPILLRCLAKSKTLIASMLVLLGLSLWLFGSLGGEFIPNLEEGDFAVELSMEQGTSLKQMVETCSQAEKLLKDNFPEVKQAVSRIGSAEIPTDPMPVERADMMVALTPKKQWTSAGTTAGLMEKMEQTLKLIPGLNVEMSQPIQMRNNELVTGIKQDVAVKIFGNDMDKLSAAANEVAALIHDVKGVTNPQMECVSGFPQIHVVYDRDKMARYGIAVKDANRVVRTAFAGETAGQIFEDDRRFDIVIRMDGELRNNIANLEKLFLPLPDGGSIPLAQVADIKQVNAPAQITHENGERRIYVGFNVRGRDVESTINEIESILDARLKLPDGYYYTYGGQFENLNAAKKRLAVAVPLALVIILLLLYATVKNVCETLMVSSAVPLSAIGGIVALWLRDMPFSISAGVGFIALFGVAVLNGLVLIGQFNIFEREGVSDVRKRIVDGCMLRLRPVIMTALVASLGFLPMALSHSDGAEVQRPLATVVIGGLVTATILTLLVMPAIYKTFKPLKPLKSLKPLKPLAPLLLLSLPAKSQVVMSLDDCLRQARENNLTLQSGKIAVERARDLQATTFDLNKTDLTLSQSPTTGGGPENALGFSQSFEFPTVYGARRSKLKAETKLEETKNLLNSNALEREVSSIYCTLSFAIEQKRLLQLQDTIYSHFLSIAEARHAAGESGALEHMSARRLYEENLVAIGNADKNIENLQLQLALCLNTDKLILPAEQTLTVMEYAQEELSLFSPQKVPTVALAAQKNVVAENELRLARQAFLPDISVGASTQLLIKGFNPYGIDRTRFSQGNLMGFDVGISIPLFYGAKTARAKAAKKDVEQTRLLMEQETKNASTNFRLAQNNFLQAKQKLDYYLNHGNNDADETYRLAQLSYEKGDIAYTEYIQNLQAAIALKTAYAEAVNNYNQALIKLRYH